MVKIIFFKFYSLNIVFMMVNSSSEKWVFFKASMESVICSGLLDPINTEVTRESRSNQANAMCANFCPRCLAKSFNLEILAIFSGVM